MGAGTFSELFAQVLWGDSRPGVEDLKNPEVIERLVKRHVNSLGHPHCMFMGMGNPVMYQQIEVSLNLNDHKIGVPVSLYRDIIS